MQTVYDFDSHRPPAVTERMLRAEIARRRLRRQTRLLTVAALLAVFSMILLGIWIAPYSLALGVGSIALACISMMGGGIIALVCRQRKIYTRGLT